MEVPPPSGIVTLLTDFGGADPYVGIMKGVIKKRHARADVIDLCQQVPRYDIAVGAMFLAAAVDRFPTGTVHVAVVDPGVGTERRALVACAGGCYWVAPDNGLLSGVLQRAPRHEIRAIDVAALRLPEPSATFWGRDVFAPVGAMLSSRSHGFRALGPRVADPVSVDAAGDTRVVAIDGFGNLITSLTAARVAAEGVVAVTVAGRQARLCRTYGDVERGEALALINSYDLLEVAVAEGNAAQELGATVGEPVTVETEHDA